MTFWQTSSASWETRPEATAERSERSLNGTGEDDGTWREAREPRGQETEAGQAEDRACHVAVHYHARQG